MDNDNCFRVGEEVIYIDHVRASGCPGGWKSVKRDAQIVKVNRVTADIEFQYNNWVVKRRVRLERLWHPEDGWPVTPGRLFWTRGSG